MLILLVAASAIGAQLPATQPARAATASGRLLGVFDELSGEPIAGAIVSDALTGDHTTTSATGTVSLWFIRAQGSVVEVRKLGYEQWSSVIDPNDTMPITVVLKKVTQLAPVVSNAQPNLFSDPGLRDGFAQRCRHSHVTCVGDSTIAGHPLHSIGDFIVHADGIVCAQSGPGCAIMMHSLTIGKSRSRGSSLCRPTFFIDGREWNEGSMGSPIDNPGTPPNAPFNPSTVSRVEVYSPEVPRPSRFAGNPNCGAIVIWTKP